jgi:hypothetical protein
MADKLYIIGNGFDLHHGLKTSYGNFRDNYAKSKTQFWHLLYQVYGDELSKDMWWWNFEEMLGNVDYQHLKDSINGEALGSNIVKKLLGNEIPVSMGEWIQEVEKTAKPKKLVSLDPDALFFTFNYSLVLENVYSISKSNVWHIHNSLIDYNNGENPIVGHDFDFGQLTKQLSEYEKTHPHIRNYFVELMNEEIANGAKKAKNRIQLSNGRFASLYSGIKRYVVMGFSFNDIDMPYIEEIVKVNNDIQSAYWEVYWYSDDEGKKMLERLKRLGIKEEKVKLTEW